MLARHTIDKTSAIYAISEENIYNFSLYYIIDIMYAIFVSKYENQL